MSASDQMPPIYLDYFNRLDIEALAITDDEILTYMVDRYGDFVLYQPPFKATTVLLWAGPALLLFGGVFILLRNLRRQPAAEATLTDEERERAKRLLAGDDGKDAQ